MPDETTIRTNDTHSPACSEIRALREELAASNAANLKLLKQVAANTAPKKFTQHGTRTTNF